MTTLSAVAQLPQSRLWLHLRGRQQFEGQQRGTKLPFAAIARYVPHMREVLIERRRNDKLLAFKVIAVDSIYA